MLKYAFLISAALGLGSIPALAETTYYKCPDGYAFLLQPQDSNTLYYLSGEGYGAYLTRTKCHNKCEFVGVSPQNNATYELRVRGAIFDVRARGLDNGLKRLDEHRLCVLDPSR